MGRKEPPAGMPAAAHVRRDASLADLARVAAEALEKIAKDGIRVVVHVPSDERESERVDLATIHDAVRDVIDVDIPDADLAKRVRDNIVFCVTDLLEDQFRTQERLLRSAAAALERVQVGDAMEADMILSKVVRLDGTYIPREDKP